MEHQTFADGIGRIAIIDGIVRLDLIAHSATETDAAGKPRPVFAHRVVMGVDQFLRASQKIAETTHAIAHQGRQSQQPQQPVEPPAQAAQAQPAPQRQPVPPQPMPAQTLYPETPQNRPQGVPPQFRRESVRAEPAAQSSRPFP